MTIIKRSRSRKGSIGGITVAAFQEVGTGILVISLGGKVLRLARPLAFTDLNDHCPDITASTLQHIVDWANIYFKSK